MNRNEKAGLVDQLTSDLADAPFVVLTDFGGASANHTNEFRRRLEKHGLRMQVVKNTLTRRAIAGTEKEGLDGQLVGMTGLIISGEDATAAAKAIQGSLEKKDPIEIKGSFFEGQVAEGDAGVKLVASLPSREDLLVMLLRTLQAGPRNVLGVIRGPARDLLYLLKNYETKLADAEGGE
ncbi:MAG: 50S ribosomal protein L10 [Proteobacteria bacterium]|nr:50S ribosomal protein L10 [Pseudomonadota bacterium]MCP4919186.1 50S ribosomal protein L10 [Pseudomonadota bacterium]